MIFDKKFKTTALGIILFFYVFAFLFYFTSKNNPEIFVLKKSTLSVISEAYNAMVLLLVPFIIGSIGATARTLIADLKFLDSYKLIVASGLMASFSWLGIKSKVFIALLTPYIAKTVDNATAITSDTESEFYSMALVAVLVGAFSSNLYIFINQKIERLTGGDNSATKKE